jgi:hypothetical protein
VHSSYGSFPAIPGEVALPQLWVEAALGKLSRAPRACEKAAIVLDRLDLHDPDLVQRRGDESHSSYPARGTSTEMRRGYRHRRASPAGPLTLRWGLATMGPVSVLGIVSNTFASPLLTRGRLARRTPSPVVVDGHARLVRFRIRPRHGARPTL